VVAYPLGRTTNKERISVSTKLGVDPWNKKLAMGRGSHNAMPEQLK